MDGSGINGKRASQNVPTISVTKAPVPRPVALPTVSDIVEPSSRPDSFEEEGGDLEAGRGSGLPPSIVNHPLTSPSESRLSSSITRRPAQPPGIHPVSHGVVDPLAEVMSPPADADATTPLVRAMSDPLTDASRSQTQPTLVIETDLLADSVGSSLDVSPIELDSASGTKVAEQALVESPKSAGVVEGEEQEEESKEEKEKEKEKMEEPPENTIRLIGGGGTSGSAPLDSEPVLVYSAAEVQKQKDSDASSIKSVDSSSSTQNQSPKGHKKTKSGLGGFRRFSGFGHLKKKGSVGSVKSNKEGQQ